MPMIPWKFHQNAFGRFQVIKWQHTCHSFLYCIVDFHSNISLDLVKFFLNGILFIVHYFLFICFFVHSCLVFHSTSELKVIESGNAIAMFYYRMNTNPPIPWKFLLRKISKLLFFVWILCAMGKEKKFLIWKYFCKK